jgi:S-adenosylmethionine uptake transporter
MTLLDRLPPALVAFVAIFILSVMDALIKHASGSFGTLQIVFLRFLAGLVVMAVVVALFRPGRPSWEAVRVNGVRGLLVVVTALTFFYGLSVLPLAEALALSFLSPIFIAVLGVLLLGERAGPQVVIGLILGFAGMIVMVFGGGAETGAARPVAGVVAAIVSAFSYGLAIVLLRARATRDPVVTIVAIQHATPTLIVGALVALVALVGPGDPAAAARPIAIVPVTPGWALFFLMLGACGALGHLLLATAFARAEAARLAPIDYTSLIWAVAFGWLLFDETPGLSTLLGAAMIALGALVAGRMPRPAAGRDAGAGRADPQTPAAPSA